MTRKPKVIEYSWWGNNNEPPSHFKTKKQLAEIKLKPVNPVGVIHTKNYSLYLYDPQKSNSAIPKKKATEAQLQALAKGRETTKRNACRRR